MDNALQSILELSRDPFLAVSEGKIRMMNAVARQTFPGFRVGDSAGELIPELIAFEASDQFISAAMICGVRYTVSACRCDGLLYLTLIADPSAVENRGFFSEKQVSGLLSTLFNVGMSAERLRSLLPADGDADKTLSILFHNYYLLVRRLSNLSLLCAFNDGSLEINFHHFDLVQLCADLVSSTRLLLRGGYAPLEFTTELQSLPTCMDAPKIERLILNLLANSLLHTPKDGLVRLKLSKSGSNALISVSDNGEGIPSPQLKTVFNSFRNRFELNAQRADMDGGIGLGLCRAIAEKHGGTLILESREGEGTDVRVLLPLSPPGKVNLMSDAPDYENGGMALLFTELSGLLDSSAYTSN